MKWKIALPQSDSLNAVAVSNLKNLRNLSSFRIKKIVLSAFILLYNQLKKIISLQKKKIKTLIKISLFFKLQIKDFSNKRRFMKKI